MRTPRIGVTEEFLAQARHSLKDHHLPRVEHCLKLLSEEEIWWRPNPASNSVGNLVLHLSGNVRQWIVSGLGGAPDYREREREFAPPKRVSRRALLAGLRQTVDEACAVLERLTKRDLKRRRSIQGFQVTGLTAAFHVAEHFAFHTGQIIFVTKLKRGEDLGFTRLPGEKRGAKGRRALAAL